MHATRVPKVWQTHSILQFNMGRGGFVCESDTIQSDYAYYSVKVKQITGKRCSPSLENRAPQHLIPIMYRLINYIIPLLICNHVNKGRYATSTPKTDTPMTPNLNTFK